MVSFSQESDHYNKAIENYKVQFNNKTYNLLYNQFSNEMKEAISQEVLKEQMNSLYEQAGEIEDILFLEDFPGGKKYKVKHKHITLEYAIVLNANNQIAGLRPQLYTNDSVKVLERNTTKINLPFHEEWFVFWGGTNVTDNYHAAYKNQQGAYDLVIVKEGKTYQNKGTKNEDYYAFGKQIIAPCNGKVVQVLTGVPDNIPGVMNTKQIFGNVVVLETQKKEYLVFAHFKEKSIVVTEGQNVKQGDLLGLCGNSGNSSEPHLHLSLQNTNNLFNATGAKLFFDKIVVNGKIKEDYLPIKNEKIQNIKL